MNPRGRYTNTWPSPNHRGRQCGVEAAQDVQVGSGPDGSVGLVAQDRNPRSQSSDGRLPFKLCH